MNRQQVLLYALCKTIYRPCSIQENCINDTVFVGEGDWTINKNTTFNVCKLLIQDKEYFFRECKRHDNFKIYLRNILEEYFDQLNDSGIQIHEKEKIINIICSKKIIRKIYKMGVVNDEHSIVARFFDTNDLSLFGLEELNYIDIESLRSLIQYLWGEIYSYRLNSGVMQGNFQSFNSSKSIATKSIANLIGLDYLIPDIKMVKLVFPNGMTKVGTLMEKVDGKIPKEMTYKEKMNISSNFQRDCNSLNILDAICHEKDHRPGNYFVKLNKDGKVATLQAFDNDAPMTFFLTSNINLKTYWGSSALLTSSGTLNLTHLDKKLAENILGLTKGKVYSGLRGILTKIQIHFVWRRIYNMQMAIRKTCQKNPDFLLCENEWSQETIREELRNKNLNTYMKIFCMSKNREKNYDD